MKKLRKKIYMTAGYNTIALGTGRKEFKPKEPRPGLEHYIKEAGQGVLKQIGSAKNVDETVIANFMAARFNNQGNLAGFAPYIDEELNYKPAVRVEGACGSGGLAIVTAIKSVLADMSDVVLTLGVEVQNTVKAIYVADHLALAGWQKERKTGHAYYFPGKFSDRAGAYYKAYGREKARKAMARWYRNAIENARLCPTAQEYHNSVDDLEKLASAEPNPKYFTAHTNAFDCSKVSDGASAIAVVSEDGLEKIGIDKHHAVEVVGVGVSEADITKLPSDITRLHTTENAIGKALRMAGISKNEIATVECHDCFTIAGIMATEALGFADYGNGTDFVLEGNTARDGFIPFNTTGGLIGWGHPTGATGVHQAVTVWEQLTGKAGKAQIKINPSQPYAISINMGGDDKTVVAVVYRKQD